MRSPEEIKEVFKHPAQFIKSDFYKVGLVELYPFVPADLIPKIHREQMSSEVISNWNPEEEIANFNFEESALDELAYIRKLATNDEVNAAVFRTPRLLALVWLQGYSIESYDKSLSKILSAHSSVSKASLELRKLLKRVAKDCRLEN